MRQGRGAVGEGDDVLLAVEVGEGVGVERVLGGGGGPGVDQLVGHAVERGVGLEVEVPGAVLLGDLLDGLVVFGGKVAGDVGLGREETPGEQGVDQARGEEDREQALERVDEGAVAPVAAAFLGAADEAGGLCGVPEIVHGLVLRCVGGEGVGEVGDEFAGEVGALRAARGGRGGRWW
ncbi:MAG: hypothetical protein HND58_07725 [Planctomycetota bacterium]|nr:MAG: hypothetical protein HND58_07725 [Planctomycetota bacterium]